MCSTVVRRRNGAETFLSRCIPNLKFYGFLIEFDGSDFLMVNIEEQPQWENITEKREKIRGRTYKIYSNRGDVWLSVCIIRKSEQQARLSDTWVSNQEQFEEIIATKFAMETEIMLAFERKEWFQTVNFHVLLKEEMHDELPPH